MSDLNILFEQYENEMQYAKNLFKVARYDDSYILFPSRLIQICGLVVKERPSESGNMGSIPAGC